MKAKRPPHRHVIDRVLLHEVLVHVLPIDRVLEIVVRTYSSVISRGCPGCNAVALSTGGLAITSITVLDRVSLL